MPKQKYGYKIMTIIFTINIKISISIFNNNNNTKKSLDYTNVVIVYNFNLILK